MLIIAMLIPVLADARIIASDGSLVRESSGVIYDMDTGLEWYPGPDQGMNWQEARDWVAGLKALGGGWRMPEHEELDALHRIGDGVRSLTPLVPLSGYWIWTGQNRDRSSKWLFGFSYGGEGWSGQAPADGGRAMAVRVRTQHD